MRSNHRRDRGRRLLAAAVVIGYSWVATGLRPFTLPIEVAVGIPTLTLLGLSWYRSGLGRPDRRPRPPPRSSLVAWAALVGVLAVWELAAYVSSPRRDHPTLSSISDDITSSHAARAVVFALWLALGLHLFARRVSLGASPA